MSFIKCEKLTPLHDSVLITDMSFDEQVTSAGIIIGSDDGKSEGIKPRWGKVYAVGPKQDKIKVGDWILVEHGRWTRSVKIEINESDIEVRRVETKSIMMTADTKPTDIYFGVSNKSNIHTFDFSKPMF